LSLVVAAVLDMSAVAVVLAVFALAVSRHRLGATQSLLAAGEALARASRVRLARVAMLHLRHSEASLQLAVGVGASPTAVLAVLAAPVVAPVTMVVCLDLAQAVKASLAVPPAQATTEPAVAVAPVALVYPHQVPAMAATAALVSLQPSLARPRPMAAAAAAPLTSPPEAAVALAVAAWAGPATATPLRGALRLERSTPVAEVAVEPSPALLLGVAQAS
jgi:hypothetical protein